MHRLVWLRPRLERGWMEQVRGLLDEACCGYSGRFGINLPFTHGKSADCVCHPPSLHGA